MSNEIDKQNKKVELLFLLIIIMILSSVYIVSNYDIPDRIMNNSTVSYEKVSENPLIPHFTTEEEVKIRNPNDKNNFKIIITINQKLDEDVNIDNIDIGKIVDNMLYNLEISDIEDNDNIRNNLKDIIQQYYQEGNITSKQVINFEKNKLWVKQKNEWYGQDLDSYLQTLQINKEDFYKNLKNVYFDKIIEGNEEKSNFTTQENINTRELFPMLRIEEKNIVITSKIKNLEKNVESNDNNFIIENYKKYNPY